MRKQRAARILHAASLVFWNESGERVGQAVRAEWLGQNESAVRFRRNKFGGMIQINNFCKIISAKYNGKIPNRQKAKTAAPLYGS
ncbi:MAG: hypothetical protein ACI4QV_00405 [Acutalibacteraceae bacterium]